MHFSSTSSVSGSRILLLHFKIPHPARSPYAAPLYYRRGEDHEREKLILDPRDPDLSRTGRKNMANFEKEEHNHVFVGCEGYRPG